MAFFCLLFGLIHLWRLVVSQIHFTWCGCSIKLIAVSWPPFGSSDLHTTLFAFVCLYFHSLKINFGPVSSFVQPWTRTQHQLDVVCTLS